MHPIVDLFYSNIFLHFSDGAYRDEHVFIGTQKFIASLCALPVSAQFPEGLILAGSNDCAIYGFTMQSKEPVLKLLGHSGAVCSLSAGFGLFVSGSWDGTARVWSGQNCNSILEGHTQAVWATEVYPVQNIIITGSADHTIRIWRAGICENVLYVFSSIVRDFLELFYNLWRTVLAKNKIVLDPALRLQSFRTPENVTIGVRGGVECQQQERWRPSSRLF
ncbi:phospholipase A-2-activating protein [Trichonephila clavipes]|nr:phospholipase A-2-activating protein [Trichonephila clavipes]